MPELPEVEAWRRQLDPLVKKSPIEKAGPAHIATLKTIEPPLSVLDGEGFKGVERRAKRFLLPTDDEELVLMVHLMSAGRLKYVPPHGKGAKTPQFKVRFRDGGELQLAFGCCGPTRWRQSSRISARRPTNSRPRTSRASSRPTRVACTRCSATSG
jgi:formamidopyrimidine-DNA glycosylase